MKKIKLGDFCEVVGGQIMSRVMAKGTDQTVEERIVIIPKAITSNGMIDSESLPKEKLMMHVDEKRLTKFGDIVIKLSTPFDSCIINEKYEGCVVPSFCAVIRNNGLLNDYYLQAFLLSDSFKETAKNITYGMTMSIIPTGKLKEIEIPIASKETQDEIGNRFKETQEKIEVLKKITELEVKRNNLIFKEIMK